MRTSRKTRARRRAEYALALPAVRGAGTALVGIGLLALFAVYGVALWRMPDWMGVSDPKDRHNARLLVVSVGGAVVVAISLLYTARSYRLSHRGQVTDRFTKALERLSSPDIDARLGGIHALAHVANDSRPHHDDVVEVLEAFLRRRAPEARFHLQSGPTLSRPAEPPLFPDTDVQAALTALGRRAYRPERRQLDLSRLHFTVARLADTNFRRAKLRGADLMNAYLMCADLEGADLSFACLSGASLDGANLRRARLYGAELEGAHLPGANLQGVNLKSAKMSLANLEGSNLEGASLIPGSMGRVHLEGAKLAGADLSYADLASANLEGADLRNTNLTAANLTGITGVTRAQILAIAQVSERTRF